MATRDQKDKQPPPIKDTLPLGVISTIPHDKPDEHPRDYLSHLHLLYLIVVSIFFAEVVAMILIYELPPLPYQYITLIDAGVMTILIFPVLYFLSFRPLIRHIEERKRTEEALQAVSSYNRRLIEASIDPLVTIGPDGKITDVNEATETAIGVSRERLIGDNFLNYFTEPEKARKVYQKVLAEGFVRDYPLTIRHTSGKTTDVLYNATVYKNEVGEIQGVFAAARDITERKRAEELNRQLSRIVEQTEDTVVVTNPEGVIEYVNPAFERLTGYTREETLGKTSRVIKSDIHGNEFYRTLWNTILKGDVFQGEIANRKKNGDLYYEVKTIAPLRDAQDKITHFVATGKDITEHKLDEARLRRAYSELELRVQERTEELRIANSELEEEIIEHKQAEMQIQQYSEELRAANEELIHFNNAMVGRELRMIELKKEVNELCKSAGRAPRYSLDFEKE